MTTITKFYEAVAPHSGNKYCIAWTGGKGMVHDYVTKIEDIEPKVRLLEKKGNINVFLAMSSFDKLRSNDDAQFRRSFFVDLDCGEGKFEDGKGYDTKQDALNALKEFIKDTGLPLPTLVDSGNGIHAYWPVGKDMSMEEWEPYNVRLYTLCKEKNFLADQAVTDRARIMRMPYTHNCKNDNPKPTYVINDDIVECSLDDMKKVLDAVEIQESLGSILKQAAREPLTEEEKKDLKLNNYDTSFKNIIKKGESGCPQIIRIARKDANDVSEHEWWSMLSIMQHCSDRSDVIHAFSKDHKDYKYEDTEEKANRTQDKPHTCETFNKLEEGICSGCKHYKKISSPLQLGKEFIPAPAVIDSPVTTKQTGTDLTKEFVGLPKDMYPFVYGSKDGGIYYEHPVSYDEDGQPVKQPPTLVSQYDLYPIKRIFSEVDGEILEMKIILPRQSGEPEHRVFRIPVVDIYQTEKFKQVAKWGVTWSMAIKGQQGYLMEYFHRWVDHLIKNNDAEVVRGQMGWTMDKKAFVIGNKEYRLVEGKAKEFDSATSDLVRGIARHLCPTGSYEKWKECIQMLNKPNYELHAFTFLTSFGSILLDRTSTSGMTISLYSSDSSTGKTGALYSAISVWGHPKETSVLGTDEGATRRAAMGRYLALRNIPFGFDEMGGQDPKIVADIIHSISQGKAKLRMQSSVNAERDYEMYSSMIAIFTSNHSVYKKLIQVKRNPNGEMARLLEFEVDPPQELVKDAYEGKRMFAPLHHNYGWAGPEYIKGLLEMSDEKIEQRLAYWTDRIIKDFNSDGVYRYYHNTVAATFTGAEIAIELGIIDFDIERIYTHIVSQMIKITNNVINLNKVDYSELFGEYLGANHRNTIQAENHRIVVEPLGTLLIRDDLDLNKVFLQTTAFDKFLIERGTNVDDFIAQMNLKGYKTSKMKKRIGAGWKPGASASAVSCVVIERDKLVVEMLQEQEQEQKDKEQQTEDIQ